MSDNPLKTGHIRRDYQQPELHGADLDADPLPQFASWLDEAAQTDGLSDHTAMVLATVSADGQPCQRIVLLKDYSTSGFTFFTHLDSDKARHIASDARVSLLFPWLALSRQVIITGRAERTDTATDKQYFATRPRASQIAAWASHQSRKLASRAELEAEYIHQEQVFDDVQNIPCPPFWGGYRVVPEQFEFWQGRPSRLHDRFIYTRVVGDWLIERLSP